MKYCPHCESLLTADTQVFVMDGEVIGCEECVNTSYADEYFDEEEINEEYVLRYMDDIWADMRAGIL